MAALCRLLGVLVSLVALVGVVVTGVLVARRTNERPSTYDATIQAYIVNMAPEVSGRIVELNVVDNQQVKKGQVLFQIDPKPYQLSVDQARTAKETAQVALERARQMAAQAREAITSPKPTEAQLDGARATLALAERNLDKDRRALAIRRPNYSAPGGRRTVRTRRSSPLHDHQHRALVCDRQFPRDRSRRNQARAARDRLCDG